MPVILEDSSAILSCIEKLFDEDTRHLRRVIVVAYVGAAAPRLLPDVKDVELYCSPDPPSTNPYGLQELRKLGAKIYLVKNLHMKLYWVQDLGALITSANLSLNALGEEGLFEIGVFLEDHSDLDIDSIIEKLRAKRITSARLKELQQEYDRIRRADKAKGPKIKPKKFLYSSRIPDHRDDFRLGHLNDLVNIRALQKGFQICLCRGARKSNDRIFLFKPTNPYSVYTMSENATRLLLDPIDHHVTQYVAEIDEYLEIPGRNPRFWEALYDEGEFNLWDIDDGPLAYFEDKRTMLLWILRVYKMPFEIYKGEDFKWISHVNGRIIDEETLKRIQNGFRNHEFKPVLTDAKFERKKEKIIKIANRYKKRKKKKMVRHYS